MSFETTKPALAGIEPTLPPGLYRRDDGSYIWKPSPKYRKAGHPAFIIKDANNQLVVGDDTQASAICNRHIERLKAGTAVVGAPNLDRTIDVLIDLFKTEKGLDHLSPGYRSDQLRMFAILTDEKVLGGRLVAALERTALIKLFRTLQLPENYGINEGYKAHGTCRQLLYFAVEKGWITTNPLQQFKSKDKFKVTQPEGRIEVWEFNQLHAFVTLCDYLGAPSVGDFMIMALCTSQSVSNVCALPRSCFENPVMVDNDKGFYALPYRSKTDKPAFCPMTQLIQDRIADMNRRQQERWPGKVFAKQIINDRTGRPYPYENIQDVSYAVKLLLAGKLDEYNARPQTECKNPNAHRASDRTPVLPKIKSLGDLPIKAFMPEVLELTNADLRDTGLSHYVLASENEDIGTLIAGHASGKIVDATKRNKILEKHYRKKYGKPVIKALAAFDELYEMFNPPTKPKLRLVA